MKIFSLGKITYSSLAAWQRSRILDYFGRQHEGDCLVIFFRFQAFKVYDSLRGILGIINRSGMLSPTSLTFKNHNNEEDFVCNYFTTCRLEHRSQGSRIHYTLSNRLSKKLTPPQSRCNVL